MSHWPVNGTFAGTPGLRWRCPLPLFRDDARSKRDRVGMVSALIYRGEGAWAWSGWLRSREDYRDLVGEWWPWDQCSAVVGDGTLLGVALHNDGGDLRHVVSPGPVPALPAELRSAVFD